MSRDRVAKTDAARGDGVRAKSGGRRPRTLRAACALPALSSVVAACALLSAASVRAGPTEDCNQVRDLARQLRGCTAYIKQGRGAPENLATAYLNRANIYARRRNYKRALTDYAAAISHDPDNALLFYNRGNAYFDSEQYDRAIADYTRAVDLDKSFALAYLNRGLARERQGESAAAAADFRHVLMLDPKAEVARRRLQRLQSQ